jgi:BlaI family transcriptional regulator, penicillinase repressor
MRAKAQRLTKLEFSIMEVLWSQGESSIRQVLDQLGMKKKPSYITVQTTIYRMEAKEIVERSGKVGNFHLFRALLSRDEAQKTLLDEMLSYFGGHSQPVMAYLVKSGKLSLDDVKEAEQMLRDTRSKGKSK